MTKQGSLAPAVQRIFDKQNKEYLKSIKLITENAAAYQKLLFSSDFEQLKNPEDIFLYLRLILRATVLHPNQKLTNKLKSLQVSKQVLKYYVDCKKIDRELQKLEKRKILVLRNLVLIATLNFLQNKISMSFYNYAGALLKQMGGAKPDLRKETTLFYRRLKHPSKKAKFAQSPLDFVNFELAESFRGLQPTEKQARTAHINLMDANTDSKFLNILLTSCVPSKAYEQTQYLSLFAPLFRLVCPDKPIWTKGEFEARSSSYENNYRRYLALRIKRLSGYKPADHDYRQILLHIK